MAANTERLRVAQSLDLSFEWGGVAPGMSGVSKLQLRGGKETIEIVHIPDIDDLSDDTPRPISVTNDWTAIVQALIKDDLRCYYTEGSVNDRDFPWPDAIRIKGRASAASDLIACAWAGPPFSDFANALTELPDADIKALRLAVGSLT